MSDKWDHRFMSLAREHSEWSKDPSTQVGCVIVSPDRTGIVSGYNGFPRGIDDRLERYQDRETKYKYIVHSEPNAIINAKRDVRGWTIYTYPFPPCHECAKLIIQAGIVRVVCPPPNEDQKQRWGKKLEWAASMFKEAGVMVYYYEAR